MGRFLSPDWAAQAEPVPYAKLDNPQSLNLYAYVGNNPIRNVDIDGHLLHGIDAFSCEGTTGGACSNGTWAGSSSIYTIESDLVTKIQQQTSLTNVIYNETSAFSPNPNAKSGTTGSAEDFHNGRVAVGEAAEGIITGKHPERVLAKTELSKGEAKAIKAGYGSAVAAYGDSKSAATQVLAGSNTTNGATQYRTRFSSDVTTNVGRKGPKVPVFEQRRW